MSVAWIASTHEMDRVFGDEGEVQSWLDFEAGLARAQAGVGLVPEAAAREITRQARVENVSLDDLRQEIAHAVHPIVPVVRALSGVCQGDAGKYVHWGATTQDVLDTGLMLRMRQGWRLVRRDTIALTSCLRELAVHHKDTVMPGRTHFQHGVPITFGYKLAVFVDELVRHVAFVDRLAPTAFVGQLGGATGTLAAMGSRGLEVRRRTMAELGLGEPAISWHVARDRPVQVVFGLVLISATVARAAQEVVHLQRTEVSEVAEPSHAGKVGSSTMPHKRNPAVAESIVTAGELVANQLPIGLGSLRSLHERDKAVYSVENDYIPHTYRLLHRMLEQARVLFDGLDVNVERMGQNIDMIGGFAYSEAVMMALAEAIGHQDAHELVYDISMRAVTAGIGLKEALLADDRARALIDADELARLTGPDAVRGSAAEQVQDVCGEGGSFELLVEDGKDPSSTASPPASAGSTSPD